MKSFFLGFAMASVLWLGVVYAQSSGMFDLFEFWKTVPVNAPVVAPAAKAETVEVASTEKKGRRLHRRVGKRQEGQAEGASYDTGEAVSGDDLGGAGAREMDLGSSGREDQLTESEIDHGVDGVFRGIERCLVLVPADAPATGKVVIGMHIAPSGRVTGVDLAGPSPLVSGEPGACIRRAVGTIRYRAFDGPDMIAHYPVTFE